MHRRSTQTYSVAVYAARQPNPARNRCVRIIGESRTSFEPFRIETFALFQNVPRGDRCVIGCQLSSLELQVCFKFITKRFSIYCIANKLPTQIIHHGVFVPQYHIWQPLLVSSEFSPAVPFKNCRISSSCSSFRVLCGHFSPSNANNTSRAYLNMTSLSGGEAQLQWLTVTKWHCIPSIHAEVQKA